MKNRLSKFFLAGLIFVLLPVSSTFSIGVTLTDPVKTAANTLITDVENAATDQVTLNTKLKELGPNPTIIQLKGLSILIVDVKSRLTTARNSSQSYLSALKSANLDTTEYDTFVSSEVTKSFSNASPVLSKLGGARALISSAIQDTGTLLPMLDSILNDPSKVSTATPRNIELACKNFTNVMSHCAATHSTSALCTNASKGFISLGCQLDPYE